MDIVDDGAGDAGPDGMEGNGEGGAVELTEGPGEEGGAGMGESGAEVERVGVDTRGGEGGGAGGGVDGEGDAMEAELESIFLRDHMNRVVSIPPVTNVSSSVPIATHVTTSLCALPPDP